MEAWSFLVLNLSARNLSADSVAVLPSISAHFSPLSSPSAHLKIFRFIARFPFDVATKARHLVCGNSAPGQHGIERLPQVLARDRLIIAAPRFVHLSAIDKLPLAIEEEKIRRARGAV